MACDAAYRAYRQARQDAERDDRRDAESEDASEDEGDSEWREVEAESQETSDIGEKEDGEDEPPHKRQRTITNYYHFNIGTVNLSQR